MQDGVHPTPQALGDVVDDRGGTGHPGPAGALAQWGLGDRPSAVLGVATDAHQPSGYSHRRSASGSVGLGNGAITPSKSSVHRLKQAMERRGGHSSQHLNNSQKKLADFSGVYPSLSSFLAPSILYLQRRTLLGPTLPPVIEPGGGNVGMSQPLLHLGNIRVMRQGIGRRAVPRVRRTPRCWYVRTLPESIVVL